MSFGANQSSHTAVKVSCCHGDVFSYGVDDLNDIDWKLKYNERCASGGGLPASIQ